MSNKKILTVAAAGISALGAATLVYGALVESKRLQVDRFTIKPKDWPERLDGFKIVVLADFHLNHEYGVEVGKKAVDLALDEEPDMVVLAGDFVGYWSTSSPKMLGEVLEPLLILNGNVVAVPGNHDYADGSPEILRLVLDELNIKLLRNENWTHQGICWVGIDSANEDRHDVAKAFAGAGDDPRIVVWHEPDVVDQLPADEAVLQISGHSHGGQYRLFGFPADDFAQWQEVYRRLLPGRADSGFRNSRGWNHGTAQPIHVPAAGCGSHSEVTKPGVN